MEEAETSTVARASMFLVVSRKPKKHNEDDIFPISPYIYRICSACSRNTEFFPRWSAVISAYEKNFFVLGRQVGIITGKGEKPIPPPGHLREWVSNLIILIGLSVW